MEHEQIAVLRTIRERLLQSESNIWVDRLYVDTAPIMSLDTDQITRPYAIMFVSADQRYDLTKGDYAKLVITVKIIADDKLTALQGSAQVASLLDSQGVFDYPDTPLRGGIDWVIKSVRRDKNFTMLEDVGNSVYIYHEGSTYNFEVEGIRNNG